MCHFDGCDNASYDDCAICGKPTCRQHGKEVGENFVCFQCIDEEDEESW